MPTLAAEDPSNCAALRGEPCENAFSSFNMLLPCSTTQNNVAASEWNNASTQTAADVNLMEKSGKESVEIGKQHQSTVKQSDKALGYGRQALEFMVTATERGNAFGTTYRSYDSPDDWGRECVQLNYKLNHMNQSVEFVRGMHKKHLQFDKMRLGVWEAIELLNEVVDDSDPDTALPQIEHLLQTAEAIRKAYPEDDWFHLTGLLHDLGKVLAHSKFGAEPQWAVVGDTFPVGCAHDPVIVYHTHFKLNPDWHNPQYNTKYGMYSPSCGLREVVMSWGHDEYLYRVLKHNGCLLPPAALFIVRYHSFYALHTGNAYTHMMDEYDRELLPWLKEFQKFDLYSKSDEPMDMAALKEYYMGLIHKYFPTYDLQW